MGTTRTITSIETVDPGSNPDVDSDFAKAIRDDVLRHVTEEYGKRNIANIITFDTIAAKSAIRSMGTIYHVPQPTVNKLVSLIPAPIDNIQCTLEDIYDPDSDFFEAAAEFRTMVASGQEWKTLVEGARHIAGRVRSTGMHACGVIMSSQPLDEVIPLQVRQRDRRVMTQWTYHDCEDLGLIKMDFLGLDTVDIIQNTVENIMRGGKTPPNMIDIIHGDMDDPRVYELFRQAHTLGIFQFGSQTVRNLLSMMLPTEFKDLVACTAVARPGPMKMESHIRYANRKNGKEDIDYIHQEFVGSALEEILRDTYGLCVYQEQIMQIANRIAGMTLGEADKLRKAMGKKRDDVMAKMKPIFYSGALDNGFSQQAVDALWGVMVPFAKYGFNKSHSVAYAMTAYQAAFLKVHYPAEFMSALISQKIGNKDLVRDYLKECSRMGLDVGTVDINGSHIQVSPDTSGRHDILYGLAGVDHISDSTAQALVSERNDKGPFTSVQDVVDRGVAHGVTTKTVYENLALAGAFDSLNVSRREAFESMDVMMDHAKTRQRKGDSLFDMLLSDSSDTSGPHAATSLTPTQNLHTDGDAVVGRGDDGGVLYRDFSLVERLRHEADMEGMYLSDHPLAHLRRRPSTRIEHMIRPRNGYQKETLHFIAALTDMEVKKSKTSQRITVTLDDGSGYISARLSRDMVDALGLRDGMAAIESLYDSHATHVPTYLSTMIDKNAIVPLDPLVLHDVYEVVVDITYATSTYPYRARVEAMRPVVLDHEGRLPIRLRIPMLEDRKRFTKLQTLPGYLSRHYAGERTIMVGYRDVEMAAHLRRDHARAVLLMNRVRRGDFSPVTGNEVEQFAASHPLRAPWADMMAGIHYIDTGYTSSDDSDMSAFLSRVLGYEHFDFGMVDIEPGRTP